MSSSEPAADPLASTRNTSSMLRLPPSAMAAPTPKLSATAHSPITARSLEDTAVACNTAVIKTMLSELDPDLYDTIEMAMSNEGGSVADLAGLSKPQIYDVLSTLHTSAGQPVCPHMWRGRVADVIIRYHRCDVGHRDSCGSSVVSRGDSALDTKTLASSEGEGEKMLVNFMEMLGREGIKLRSLRGLTRVQLIDQLSPAVPSAEQCGRLADSLLSYFSRSSRASMQLAAEQLAEEKHAEAAEEGQPFMASLVQFPKAQQQPFKNKLIDELILPSDLEIWLGSLEKTVPLLRATIIEFTISCLFTYMHIGVIRTAIAGKALVPPALPIAVFHFGLILVSIFSAAAASGAHFNPLMSMSTCITGHTTVLRTVLYIVAQLCGATFGAMMMRAGAGGYRFEITSNNSKTTGMGGDLAVCTAGGLSHAELFVAEFASSFFLLFLAYNLALDPKQLEIFGAIGAPLFLAMGIAVATYATSGSGFDDSGFGGGPQFNAGPCFGAAMAAGSAGFESTFWVYFGGEFVAGLVHGLLFFTAQEGSWPPPLLKEKRAHLKREGRAGEILQQLLVEEGGPLTAKAADEDDNSKEMEDSKA